MAKEDLNSHAHLEAGYAKLGQDEKLDASSLESQSQSGNRCLLRRIAYYIAVAVTSILAGYLMAPIVAWLISTISPSCHHPPGNELVYDGTTLVTEIYQVPTTALPMDGLDKLVIDEIETTGLDKLQKRQDDPIDTTPGSGEGDDTTSTEEETTSTNEETVTDTSAPGEPTEPVTSGPPPTDSVSTTTEIIPEVPTTTTEEAPPTTVTTETSTESEPEAPPATTTAPSTTAVTSETETSTEVETTEAPSTSSEAETTSAGDSETFSETSTTFEPPTTTTTEEESETTTTEDEPSSSIVHETYVETLQNGATTVITSTFWVEVEPTSGSEPSDPDLQNAASRPTAMVLSLMMVFSAMILLG